MAEGGDAPAAEAPAPVDEPTRDLDLQTLDQLVGALASYRGGLLVVSHDDAFLRRLDVTT
ncbi:hypothetical protein ACFFOM_04015 [Microlunatus capsulatus]|uniref:ATPase subunit of ABC transporter with duplicated ATPase domains n=1 Tax=Microlunatus capsulatus TaxID=99117 RepID=A0ABS4Z282_9ACTN|nr:hypothetical protein [Microlunatus capsulatus]MBP2415101.1 ATPase subunit of ABC transporter with duplicated ATPase domains [Microlunatus capsulatus]